MKPLIIRRSKTKSFRYLFISACLVGVVVYLFVTDTKQYPKGKSFYWVGVILSGLTTLYFLYNFINKTPLYIITSEGISTGNKRQLTLWADLSSFECIDSFRHIHSKYAILYDKTGHKVYTIDFSDADISVERMKRLLKIKLKQK
jgi:hypothetical protein